MILGGGYRRKTIMEKTTSLENVPPRLIFYFPYLETHPSDTFHTLASVIPEFACTILLRRSIALVVLYAYPSPAQIAP